MAEPKHSPEPSQVDKFRDLARELECDDDEAAFAERVKKIATAPRPAKDEKKPHGTDAEPA